jgi:hypothetical protein
VAGTREVGRWYRIVRLRFSGRSVSGGSVLNGQVHDAEEALALHFRMKILLCTFKAI